jgi:hypothetical protein
MAEWRENDAHWSSGLYLSALTGDRKVAQPIMPASIGVLFILASGLLMPDV